MLVRLGFHGTLNLSVREPGEDIEYVNNGACGRAWREGVNTMSEEL